MDYVCRPLHVAMAKKVDPQKIITIIDGKSADIETIDNNILMETVGVAMAIDKLRESLDKVESHLDGVLWNNPQKCSF